MASALTALPGRHGWNVMPEHLPGQRRGVAAICHQHRPGRDCHHHRTARRIDRRQLRGRSPPPLSPAGSPCTASLTPCPSQCRTQNRNVLEVTGPVPVAVSRANALARELNRLSPYSPSSPSTGSSPRRAGVTLEVAGRRTGTPAHSPSPATRMSACLVSKFGPTRTGWPTP